MWVYHIISWDGMGCDAHVGGGEWQTNVHKKCQEKFMKEQPLCKDLTPTTGLRLALQKTKRRQTGPTLGELYNWKGLALYHGSNYDEAIKIFTDSFAMATSSGKYQS